MDWISWIIYFFVYAPIIAGLIISILAVTFGAVMYVVYLFNKEKIKNQGTYVP